MSEEPFDNALQVEASPGLLAQAPTPRMYRFQMLIEVDVEPTHSSSATGPCVSMASQAHSSPSWR